MKLFIQWQHIYMFQFYLEWQTNKDHSTFSIFISWTDILVYMNSVIKFYITVVYFLFASLIYMLYNLGNGFRNTTRAYVQTIQFTRGFIKLIFSNEYNQSSTNSNSSHSTRSYPIARLDLVNSIKIIISDHVGWWI